MFQEHQSSQRLQPEAERRKKFTALRPSRLVVTLLQVNPPRMREAQNALFSTSPRRTWNPLSGGAQRVALSTQPRPTAARRFPAAAGAPRSLSRRPVGGGGQRPVGGAPAQSPRLPPPTRKRLRRGEPRASAQRGGRQGGREARRGREGGSRREPPPLAARVPAGRMGRFEPGSRAGPAPSFLLP